MIIWISNKSKPQKSKILLSLKLKLRKLDNNSSLNSKNSRFLTSKLKQNKKWARSSTTKYSCEFWTYLFGQIAIESVDNRDISSIIKHMYLTMTEKNYVTKIQISKSLSSLRAGNSNLSWCHFKINVKKMNHMMRLFCCLMKRTQPEIKRILFCEVNFTHYGVFLFWMCKSFVE